MLDARLKHVVAVAQSGSFTRAANEIGLTQSGITKSVADLEQQVGFAIFYRTAKGAVLTEHGADFVERAKRLLDDARVLFNSEPGHRDPFATTLRIGVCPASLERLLVEPLEALLTQHPSIKFDIVGAGFERVGQLLRSGGVDVAVGFDDAFAELSGLKREPIATLHTVLVTRKGHPILAERKISQSSLVNYDFVIPAISRPFGRNLHRMFEKQGVEWQNHLHTIDSIPIAMRIIETSDVIGVASIEHTKSKAFADTFERVPCDSPFPPMQLCCAIRTQWEPPPPVRAFLRLMQDSRLMA